LQAFRWNEWNLEHCTVHGCTVGEVELVVRNAARGFPSRIGDEKWRVIGRGTGNRLVQVVYVLDADATIYPIHAMPLTTRRRRSR
jgi:uncharacterized DUF497 family protein